MQWSLTPPDAGGLGSWPARRARITPHNIAVIGNASQHTYAEWAERIARLASFLRAQGVRPGDRVAQIGPNQVEVLETFFASWLLGAICVPLNFRLAAAEIAYMIEDCGAGFLVESPSAADLVAGHRNRLPSLVIGPDFENAIAGSTPLEHQPEVKLADPALILYTSGTTGKPKGAVLTHGSLTWNTINQLAHNDYLSSDRALCIAPLFHCVGLCQVTLPVLFKGGSVEPVAAFDPARVLQRIGDARITGFSAVPTMLQMLVDHPAWQAADLSSLRVVLYGGSPVNERIARAWLDRGITVQQGYGMTEATAGVCGVRSEGVKAKPLSVGVPQFFTDVAVLRDGTVSPICDEPSELLVRGPNLFAGYWNRAEATVAATHEGWFRSGDLVRFDDDGWGYVVDRVKDMIISGGENVYPAEVEAVILSDPNVAEAAVVGEPDERWGEVGVAFVTPRPGCSVDEDSIRRHLESLGRFKRPKRIVIVDRLPRNATGKILKHELRLQLATTPHDSEQVECKQVN
ncbi:long-chain fatty acid--CoA ligase [Nocardia sp. NPDC005366]|uniref:acyl-CoA synthetase n=1 Tax=Nocardia sp. NPDC005366 TaxID=3156878 RepID=UPI0033BAF188